jgi:hypothetical protein
MMMTSLGKSIVTLDMSDISRQIVVKFEGKGASIPQIPMIAE